LQWAANAAAESILAVQPSSDAVQRVFTLVNSEFTYTNKDYHYKTIIYGEASVMFKTNLANCN